MTCLIIKLKTRIPLKYKRMIFKVSSEILISENKNLFKQNQSLLIIYYIKILKRLKLINGNFD
ncbi:hypothetical protein ULMS_16620 [Patiriisocius marinistellae]|uniref:Uncharacterized protein n=1 Tax=Patiriisocius marinistellae TaxID=2494560 RepID=A0A5J4FY96_9FLAO|nr:hypothetical protein ULMS_16620 [Patiriisocius marinistellae]